MPAAARCKNFLQAERPHDGGCAREAQLPRDIVALRRLVHLRPRLVHPVRSFYRTARLPLCLRASALALNFASPRPGVICARAATSAAARCAQPTAAADGPRHPTRFRGTRAHLRHAALRLHADLALAHTAVPLTSSLCPLSLRVQEASSPAFEHVLEPSSTTGARTAASAARRAAALALMPPLACTVSGRPSPGHAHGEATGHRQGRGVQLSIGRGTAHPPSTAEAHARRRWRLRRRRRRRRLHRPHAATVRAAHPHAPDLARAAAERPPANVSARLPTRLARPAAAAPRRVDERGPAPTYRPFRLLPPLRRSLPSADPAPPLRRAQASEPPCVAHGCYPRPAPPLRPPWGRRDRRTVRREGRVRDIRDQLTKILAWGTKKCVEGACCSATIRSPKKDWGVGGQLLLW